VTVLLIIQSKPKNGFDPQKVKNVYGAQMNSLVGDSLYGPCLPWSVNCPGVYWEEGRGG